MGGNVRCVLGGEITRQDQAKITRQEQIAPKTFLDAVSLYITAVKHYAPVHFLYHSTSQIHKFPNL